MSHQQEGLKWKGEREQGIEGKRETEGDKKDSHGYRNRIGKYKKQWR